MSRATLAGTMPVEGCIPPREVRGVVWAAAGNLLLVAAGLLAALTVAARVPAGRCAALAERPWLQLRGAVLLLSAAAAILASRLLAVDGDLAYVRAQVDTSVPSLYRFTALWSGQEGSLLFWSLLALLIAAGVDRALRFSPLDGKVRTRVSVPLAALAAIFILLTLVEASPFKLAEPATPWRGMPLVLQTPEMVLHPPLLYLGYLLAAVPYVAYLAAGRPDTAASDRLLLRSLGRIFARWAWLSLTLGIVLGARWAYLELGWGGYWAWDPVENAALIPWLLLTAYLHLAPRLPRRPSWEAALGMAVFPLALFGAWITRAGSLQSVHAFANAEMGWWLAALCAGVTMAPIVLWLRGERPRSVSTPWGWREAVALLLVAAAALIWAGTIVPWISPLLVGARLVPDASFFTRTCAPLAGALLLVLVALVRLWATPPASRGLTLLHVGVIVVAIGLVGGVERTEAHLALRPGESETVGGYRVTLEALTEEISGVRTTVRARVRFEGDGRGDPFLLSSDKVFTQGDPQPYTAVGVAHRSWEDLQLVLAGWEPGGGVAFVNITCHPLVGFLWLGGLLMLGGALPASWRAVRGWSSSPQEVRDPAQETEARQHAGSDASPVA